MDEDGARDILRSHWLQLTTNLEAEQIVHQLQERRVLSNDEVNETISKKNRAEQATAMLTAMETKSLEELRVFAEVLVSCGAPMSLMGKKMLETIGRRSYQGVGTGSEVSMDHVQGKEAACPYPRERGLQLHCLLKLGLIMLLTLCLFTSVKWMQLQTSVLALKEHNHSLTRNHSHLLLHLTDLSKNCTTLKDACERLLHVTEIDKDSNKKLSTRAKQLMVIQKGIVDVQTHFSVNEHVEAEIKAIKDRQLKGYHDQLAKENSDLRIQLQEAVKAQVKALDNQRELYKENGQLVKELADLKTKLSEEVKEIADLRTKLSESMC